MEMFVVLIAISANRKMGQIIGLCAELFQRLDINKPVTKNCYHNSGSCLLYTSRCV